MEREPEPCLSSSTRCWLRLSQCRSCCFVAGSLQQHRPGTSCPEGVLQADRQQHQEQVQHITLLISPSLSHFIWLKITQAQTRVPHAAGGVETSPPGPPTWCSPAPREGTGLGQEFLGEAGRSDSAALSIPPRLCAYKSLGTGEGAGRSRSPRAYQRGRE